MLVRTRRQLLMGHDQLFPEALPRPKPHDLNRDLRPWALGCQWSRLSTRATRMLVSIAACRGILIVETFGVRDGIPAPRYKPRQAIQV
ncbi:hypothetical protein MAMC_00652 [Methylacidimicrobium cyclopophantes]|uniref:Uncharacterized protein n=1 Tax=Methylacidimicrobium cyclopophantes TaxID=1041766 RepID=A0A5E6MJ62_9BACT|nr:hypothetical protein MAMC_00652 [Methylacidimicrobium cyclopophantes]